MHALTTTFVNPFNENLDNDRLHNLVSGSTVIDDIAQNLLSVSQTGVNLIRVATRPRNPGCPGIVLQFFCILENVLELKKMD